jgi:hypothetical protein
VTSPKTKLVRERLKQIELLWLLLLNESRKEAEDGKEEAVDNDAGFKINYWNLKNLQKKKKIEKICHHDVCIYKKYIS